MDSPLKGRRILVVDDNDAERMLIATYLQQQGCRIYLAENGIDGIEKARVLRPELILMDTRMPDCDGLNACRLLKGDPSTQAIPIIFLSAYSAVEQRVHGLRCGAVDYVSKPFNYDELRLRLTVHLPRRGSTQAPSPTKTEATETQAGRPATSLDTLLFQAARVHLLKSFIDPPDLESLAQLVGTNRKRLSAAFRACVGLSVFDYLREERMKEAQHLLRSTALTVESIGLQLGFTSGANFSITQSGRVNLTVEQASAGCPKVRVPRRHHLKKHLKQCLKDCRKNCPNHPRRPNPPQKPSVWPRCCTTCVHL